ncbi:MAG: hypothetical protein M5U19_21285 [Microthrixaceae bacterium]|nr:hypothetical protein [Microthrixaceae bacterium]
MVTNGATEGAPVLAGPWLEMAKLCSGQVNPFKAVARRDLTVEFGPRLDAMAAAGYALSIPSSFYQDEDEAAASQQRRRRVAIGVVVVASAVVAVGVMRRRRRRRSMRAVA